MSPTLSGQAVVQLFGPEYAAKMGESERAAFARMSPEQQAIAGKFVRNAPLFKKAVVGIIFLFIAFQVVEFVLAVVGVLR